MSRINFILKGLSSVQEELHIKGTVQDKPNIKGTVQDKLHLKGTVHYPVSRKNFIFKGLCRINLIIKGLSKINKSENLRRMNHFEKFNKINRYFLQKMLDFSSVSCVLCFKDLRFVGTIVSRAPNYISH